MPPVVSWTAIRSFRLVTHDPARLIRFYAAIGFVAGTADAIPAEEMLVLGLAGGGQRHSLRLGESRIDLDRFDTPGQPYPADANAADLIFQHLALVTSDAAAAWALARAAGAVPISRDGPVRLPTSSGGVTAVKFRDPDGHPLEFIQFPPGANLDWPGKGMLGIDHSAVSVADVDVGQRWFEERGLRKGEATLNGGPEQVALDGLDGVAVDVVPMQPATKPPHVELLGYCNPGGRTHAPLAANDVAATRIVWAADQAALVRDPDGHLHQLTR